jgi:hypothetical protein
MSSARNISQEIVRVYPQYICGKSTLNANSNFDLNAKIKFNRYPNLTSLYSDDFYNKPWGVKHWLDFAEPKIPEDVAVALLDPDMIFIRPLTTKMRGQPNNLYDKRLKEADIMEVVAVGKPAAQMYGLGAPWANDEHKKFNRTKICGVGSPCLSPEQR